MFDTILNHRSIRKYTGDPVPGAVLDYILEAGTRASTTGNMQVYSIIVSTDESVKEELAPCHFNQPMVKEAPIVLTFCADFNRFNRWCRLRNADPCYDNFLSFMTAAIDALLVAQNVCVAAEDAGLGICYLGTTTYMAEKIIDVLDLPKGVVPVTTLTLGYPDEKPGLTDRLPVEAVVHREKYSDYSDTDIENLYREKELIKSYQAFVKENNKENLAQVFTDVRYKKADNILFSNALLDVLEKQDFMNNQ
ncbi:MAG: NADPH-dependent oxidoreductase [Bacteroidetes bacterium]|nr:NADPH-dependent oxidoreductase [Bacteroidota bacterium]